MTAILFTPSIFDSFDGSGHLTDEPIDATYITRENYRKTVANNESCVVLHAAFVETGFEELASE